MDNNREIQELLHDLKELKNSISTNNISHINDAVEDIKVKMGDLKSDVTEIKKEILNPETGVIVRINKLQDKLNYIEKEKIAKIEETLEELEMLNINYRQISGFKDNAIKFLWLFVGGLLAVLIDLFANRK